MSAKDYIYIAFLGLAALHFYRRGFRVGAEQTRKIWKAAVEKTVPMTELPPPETEPKLPQRVLVRGPRAFFSTSTIRGCFGKN